MLQIAQEVNSRQKEEASKFLGKAIRKKPEQMQRVYQRKNLPRPVIFPISKFMKTTAIDNDHGHDYDDCVNDSNRLSLHGAKIMRTF